MMSDRRAVRIGVVCSRVRVEEKLLFAALLERGSDYERVDARKVSYEVGGNGLGKYDAVLVRCLSHSRAYYLTRWLQDAGVPAVSPHRVVATCGDKMLTSTALKAAGLPVPRPRPRTACRASTSSASSTLSCAASSRRCG